MAVACATIAASAASAAAADGVFGHRAWTEAVAARGVDPAAAVYPFATTPEMTAWATAVMDTRAGLDPPARLRLLQDVLFDRDAFDFTYDENRTLTAEETFQQRRGNCMSFTALFVGLARSVGIPAFLVSVSRAPGVDRVDGLVIVNRHVVAGYRSPQGIEVYDFYVTDQTPYLEHTVIDDLTASAMYHTNLGAQRIRSGRLDAATEQLELATRLDPTFASAWVNLGVARRREGDLQGALEVFRTALDADPGNPSALTNLSFTYRDLGREGEAQAALAAAARRTDNPFTLIAMADLEISRGELDRARRLLRRARWNYGKEPAVYEALARLSRARGDVTGARRASERAAELKRREEAAAPPPAPADGSPRASR